MTSTEPFRIRRWRLPPAKGGADFTTCARPGRSKGSSGKVSDELVGDWVLGLPQGTVVVSLLGTKPDGRSEFSFYSFYSRRQSFQSWLHENYKERLIEVIEHPTVDLQDVPCETLEAVAIDILRLLSARRNVVLVDSGGFTRTGQVCKYLGALER
jgi:hypothetical protein